MKSLLLAAVLAASQCNPQPAPPPDPTPEPTDGVACAAACERFRVLGCQESLMTPDGGTCVDVCENAQASSAPLGLGCIVRAESCAQARSCE